METDYSTIYEHEQVKLIYSQQNGLVKITWKGKISLEIYQEALNSCLELMKNHQIRRLLVDQREVQPLSEAAQKWLYKVWFPELIMQVGANIRLAILPSPSTFRDISSKSIAKRLADKHHEMKIEYLPTERRCMEFLMKV